MPENIEELVDMSGADKPLSSLEGREIEAWVKELNPTEAIECLKRRYVSFLYLLKPKMQAWSGKEQGVYEVDEDLEFISAHLKKYRADKELKSAEKHLRALSEEISRQKKFDPFSEDDLTMLYLTGEQFEHIKCLENK